MNTIDKLVKVTMTLECDPCIQGVTIHSMLDPYSTLATKDVLVEVMKHGHVHNVRLHHSFLSTAGPRYIAEYIRLRMKQD